MKYKIRTRHGWGWEVIAVEGIYQSHPFESAIDAETFADHLNQGDTPDDALKRMRSVVEFKGGRFYRT